MADDLLGPQRDPDRPLGGQTEGLVEAVGVKALGTPEGGGQRLHRGSHDVVLGLLSGERRPAGLGVAAEERGPLVLGLEPLGHDPGPHPPGGAELGHLLEQVVVRVPEEAEPGREVVHAQARGQRRLHVGDAVGQGEGDLLDRRRAGLTDVVAGDRDGVPGGELPGAVGEGVGDDPHRRTRRIDIGPPGDVLLEDVVLDRAAQALRGDTGLLGHDLIEQQEDGRRGVDGHRRGDTVEREVGQQRPHVLDRVDGHAHLALGPRMIGVVAHLRGQVEGARQPGLAVPEEELEPLVRRLRCAEAGVLAHGPQPAAVHVGVHAAGVGVPAWLPELPGRVPAVQILGGVDGPDLDAGVGPTL